LPAHVILNSSSALISTSTLLKSNELWKGSSHNFF
jgi:hypothetical protein